MLGRSYHLYAHLLTPLQDFVHKYMARCTPDVGKELKEDEWSDLEVYRIILCECRCIGGQLKDHDALVWCSHSGA